MAIAIDQYHIRAQGQTSVGIRQIGQKLGKFDWQFIGALPGIEEVAYLGALHRNSACGYQPPCLRVVVSGNRLAIGLGKAKPGSVWHAGRLGCATSDLQAGENKEISTLHGYPSEWHGQGHLVYQIALAETLSVINKIKKNAGI